LTDAHPEATVDLGYQYRMNEDIMALSNKLKCGSEQVRDQKLVLPQAESSCSCSLSKLLDER
jgi:DNA replication ATP-dependent helicase Dna2